MRVAYLVNQYPMVSQTFIGREIRALEAQGIHVERFAIRPWNETLVDAADREEAASTRYIQSAGASGLLAALLIAVLTRPVRFAAMLLLALRMARESDRSVLLHLAYFAEACILLRWLQRARSEHLHAHFATNPAELAMYCHGLGGPPYSFTVHGPEDLERAPGLGYAQKIGRASFVVAISEFCRSELLRWCAPRDWPKIHIVRCGLDRALLAPSPSPVPAEPRLVCVGRLCAEKGHAVLLQAAAQLKCEGLEFELVLVGDGALRAELQAMIERYGLRARVHITGWQAADEVRAHISRSRALVLPSFAEGLPVVIMEAMALGRPVISTVVAAIPELVQDGVNGWLIAPGSVTACADAMRAALKADLAQLQRMAARGRGAVAARHNVDMEVTRLLHCFSQT
jgi:colanic acid/amylovoran biosynthesis glycosyltransferase